MIASWVGDKDLAWRAAAIAIRTPSTIGYGELKLDPLRGDLRCEKIVASVAPNAK